MSPEHARWYALMVEAGIFHDTRPTAPAAPDHHDPWQDEGGEA